MKATLSKDGKLRFNVNIKRRIGLSDLVDGLCWSIIRDNDFNTDDIELAIKTCLSKFNSRREILKAAINSISHDGDSVWTWSDGVGYATSEIERQAKAMVLKEFPEFYDTTTVRPSTR